MSSYKHKIALAIALFFIICIAFKASQKIGVMWDADLHASSPYFHKKLIQEGETLPVDLVYYGTLVDLSSHIAIKSLNNLGLIELDKYEGPQKGLVRGVIPASNATISITYNQLKNACVFCLCLVGFFAAYQFIKIFYEEKYAWVGVATLFLTPRFFGHSIFNFKDAPFAAFYTLTSLTAAYFISSVLSKKTSWKNQLKWCVLLSLSLSAVSSIRLGGVSIYGTTGLVFGIIIIYKFLFDRSEPFYAKLKFYFLRSLWFALVAAASLLLIFLMHPASWNDPFGWFVLTLKVLARFASVFPLLFMGEIVIGNQLPWYYVPVWILSTTPILVLLYALVGIVGASLKLKTDLEKAALLTLVFQMLFLWLFSIYRGSTLDDGLRQMLFTVPPISIFAALGIIAFWKFSKNGLSKTLALGLPLVLVFQVLTSYYSLYPYFYTYFNRAALWYFESPSKPFHKHFQGDYLALGFKEAALWINQNNSKNLPVYFFGPQHPLLLYLDKSIKTVHSPSYEFLIKAPEHYHLCFNKMEDSNHHPDCTLVKDFAKNLNGRKIAVAELVHCPSR